MARLKNKLAALLCALAFAANAHADSFAGVCTSGGGSSISLTTSGTSGASTLASSVLNIPVYQGALTLTTTGSSGASTLTGTTLNIPNYAGSGTLGYFSNSTATTSLTNNTPKSITSVTLTAGDWLVSGNVEFVPAGTTQTLGFSSAVSLVNNTLPTFPTNAYALTSFPLSLQGVTIQTTGTVRLHITTSTTVYLIGSAGFTTSTMSAGGFLEAQQID